MDESRSPQRQSGKSYEKWCNMVKLCFPDFIDSSPQAKRGSRESKAKRNVSVASVELMRLHPVFNKLSFYGVQNFLQECSLVKLRPNQLLYRQDDLEDSVYLVLFGKLVLHHRTLGALGVVGIGQTLGEESILEISHY